MAPFGFSRRAGAGLTRQEEEIISALLNTNRCLDCRSLHTILYGHMVAPPTGNIIHVYICKIRKKLAEKGITIANDWSRGYYLPAESLQELKRAMQ